MGEGGSPHHAPFPVLISIAIPIPIAYSVSHFDSLGSQSVVRKLALANAGKLLLLLALSLTLFLSYSVCAAFLTLSLPLYTFLSLPPSPFLSPSIYECAQAANALKLPLSGLPRCQ